MLKTLGECKHDSRIKDIASACVDSDDFASLINEATELLLNRGDWTGTLVPIYVCVKRGCLTFPRYVRNVRELNVCGHHVEINNVWYQFVDNDFYQNVCGGSSLDFRRRAATRGMNALGYYSTYNDVQVNSYIRAYPSTQEDIGKTVTIFGLDDNGMPLRTQHADKSWSEGVVITIGSPYGSTSTLVSRIERVLKDPTQGQVRLYAYDPTLNTLFDLAVYEPSEINPNYARYGLHMGHFNSSAGAQTCNNPCGVLALVKLAFIPVANDNDLVLIGNMRALKYAVQSVKSDEAGDQEAAAISLQKAINELNVELRNDNPDAQVAINIRSFGNVPPSYHGIGRIV